MAKATIYLPTKEDLRKLFELAKKTPEVATYSREQFENILKKAGKGIYESSAAVRKTVREFEQNVYFQMTPIGDTWAGEAPAGSDFRNMQGNISKNALTSLKEQVKGALKMDFAISDIAQLVRGYSVDGKSLDPEENSEAIAYMDKIFNAWLADKGYLSEGSIIYECDSNGEKLKDKAGNPVKADTKKVSQQINDPKEGFQKFLEGKLKGEEITFTAQEHKFPKQKPREAPKEKVAASTAATTGTTAPETKNEPEEPSAGTGMKG
ncbi:hypothetical protein [Legionella spiritensis]|uniref:Substrate of the Dot/Icm secretion system n=1 Tax=Legionella spiritensis TaxID=452 RepID=A0A0W0Z853_LEGSP|nr:hypothetical protein [Legionella spiritensis]KTD65301.1 substrate of the Dot/Icm secretion system [Legionella spiritensis]SNV29993.1 Dot/Icm secretion system substrate [Legionella spiritensis]